MMAELNITEVCRRRAVLVPRLHRTGLLSYEQWLDKTDRYTRGIIDYLVRVLKHEQAANKRAHLVIPDKAALHDAVLTYVYRTSLNRFKAYDIIH